MIELVHETHARLLHKDTFDSSRQWCFLHLSNVSFSAQQMREGSCSDKPDHNRHTVRAGRTRVHAQLWRLALFMTFGGRCQSLSRTSNNARAHVPAHTRTRTTKNVTVPGVLAGTDPAGHTQAGPGDRPTADCTERMTIRAITATPAAPAMATVLHRWVGGWGTAYVSIGEVHV